MVEVTQEDREAAARYWGNDNPPLELQREFAIHRIAAENASHQEITALRARIAELEARLEIDQAHPYDGIAARDATIAALEAERAEWVEVERLRMGKATPPTPPA